MSYSVIVSYNSTNEEQSIAKSLIDFLSRNGVQAAGGDPDRSEPSMKQGLSTARWLVLILTPEALRSPHVQSLVETAFAYVSQGRMQGILALAFLTNPVDLEDLPSPLWSTIRIYYTGERDTDLQKAFEKLSRTLSNTKVPVRTVSSPATNWASSFSSAASRPLPAILQPAPGPRSGLTSPRLVVIALFIILVFLGGFVLALKNPFARNSSGVIENTNTHSTPTIHVSPNKTHTKSTPAPSPTPDPQQLYNIITPQSNQTVLNDSMSAQSDNQWTANNTSCVFTNGKYQVSSSSIGQYEPCMETKNTNYQYFAYQVQMKFTTDGDAGGLIFRSDNTVSMFYRFSLDSAGNYSLRLCNPCSPPYDNSQGKLLKPESNAHLSAPYTLTVIALKNNIYLFVNKVLVISVDDSTLSQGGEIGVFAASKTQPTEVAFSNVKVWNLTEEGQILQSTTGTQRPG